MLVGLIGLILPEVAAPAASQAQVQAQIDKLAGQIAALDEQYNESTIHLAKLESQISDTRATSAKAQADFHDLQKVASSQAAAVYKAGPPSLLVAFLTSKSLEDFNQKMTIVGQVNTWESGIMNGLQIADQRAKQATSLLDSQLAQAKALSATLAQQRATLQSQLADQQHLLAQINEETRLAAARAAQARADAARAALAAQEAQAAQIRAAQLAAAKSSSAASHVAVPTVLPGSSRAATALSVAIAQIGKPYVWAAAGPNSFDCSGLTMFAYRAAGVSLSHSAADQYASNPHVSRDQLQPGDLVFFGSPIHHVGMYVGGGMMVDAPETGENVQVQSMMRSDYVGASRPGV